MPNESACHRRSMAGSSRLSARRLRHGKGVRTNSVLGVAPAHRGSDRKSGARPWHRFGAEPEPAPKIQIVPAPVTGSI
jgi:hypothetical protein